MYNESYARHISPIGLDDFGVVGDGVTDDINAFNAAISHLSELGGGVINLERGRTYLVSGGIVPANNIIIDGCGSTIKLSEKASVPMFSYNSATTLEKFSIYNVTLDGNNVAQNVIHITEPSPVAPDKTWVNSILFNVHIINSGATGFYCSIPGRVRLVCCHIYNNDVGVMWDREHLDSYGTTIEANRIGVQTTGNHFVWLHTTILHNTEKGLTTNGAGLGSYTKVYEAGFIGCTFIDNATISAEGPFDTCRFIGNRFLDAETYISDLTQTVVQGNHFGDGATTCAIDAVGDDCLIQANYIENCGIGLRTSSASRGMNIVGNNFESITNQCVYLTRPTRLSITDNVFKTSGVGVYASCSGGDIGFSIDGNKFQIIDTIGVHIVVATGDVNDISISSNRFWDTGLEAIKLTGTGTSLGTYISNNQITDANTNNVAGTHAIHTTRTHTGSSMTGNLIRNSGTGKADHAVLFTGTSVTDFLFDSNTARNMTGSYSYDLPASATVGDNVGTFAP